jgi:hypothetical protein
MTKIILVLLALSSFSSFASTVENRKTGETIESVCLEYNSYNRCSEFEITAIYNDRIVVKNLKYKPAKENYMRWQHPDYTNYVLTIPVVTLVGMDDFFWLGLPLVPALIVAGAVVDIVILPGRAVKFLKANKYGNSIMFLFNKIDTSKTKKINTKLYKRVFNAIQIM